MDNAIHNVQVKPELGVDDVKNKKLNNILRRSLRIKNAQLRDAVIKSHIACEENVIKRLKTNKLIRKSAKNKFGQLPINKNAVYINATNVQIYYSTIVQPRCNHCGHIGVKHKCTSQYRCECGFTSTKYKKYYDHACDFVNIFQCEICKLKIKRQDNYKRHLNIHKSLKNFQCDKCCYQTNRRDAFHRHITKVHVSIILSYLMGATTCV